MKEKIKKLIQYISGAIIFFIAIGIILSGTIAILENIIEINIPRIVGGGLLTIVIGLYLGKSGLNLFKNDF